MKEKVLRKVIESICDGYVDTLITGIDEYEKNFPYTIACANFIYEYVDIIKLDKIKRKKNNICDIQVANIKLRDSKIKKLFELGESNMIDKVIQLDARSYSIADFKRESDALEYIDILKKKYDILTEDYFLDDYQGFYFDPSFFKEINIRSTKAIEKGKMIFLYLREN